MKELLCRRLILVLLLLMATAREMPALAARPATWDMKALSAIPAVFPTETQEPGVRALFYQSVPWRGKPTRVFAYYGVPAHDAGTKLPAMVLVHGGNGSAYAEWVRMWNRRGYAAIAIDHFGRIPRLAPPGEPYLVKPVRNPDGGPLGDGGFPQIDEPVNDQWTYQAVAAVVLANSLLRSFPENDANRIGVTGISWGGFITSIVASVDSRFRFAVPVYGCGFLQEATDSVLWPGLGELKPEQAQKWTDLWDPASHLAKATMPMLWLNGSNDMAFPLGSWQRTALLSRGPRTLSIHVGLSHGQEQGATPEEIFAYANATVGTGVGLAVVKKSGAPVGGVAKLYFKSEAPLTRVELNYTSDTGPWTKRRWTAIPASGLKASEASGALPVGTRAFFFNLVDNRGLIVSSEVREVAEGNAASPVVP